MTKETIIVNPGNQKHEIDARKLTLIMPSANMAGSNIEYPNRFSISASDTIYHADRVQKLHEEFYDYWQYFQRNVSDKARMELTKPTPDEFRRMGQGAKHVMGLIDMTLKIMDKGVPLVWKYPETFLHPAWAVSLGDLSLAFSERANGRCCVAKAE